MFRKVMIIFHLAELTLYTGVFMLWGDATWSGWLITVVSLALSLRALITLLTLLIAKVPLRPLSLSFAAFAGEFYTFVKLYSFDSFLPAPALITPQGTNKDHLPILFIHGYMANSGFWRPYLKALYSRWGNTIATISLEPLHASIDDYSQQIDQRVDELLSASRSEKCLVVAHSMGGLATRSYLRNLNSHHKIKAVITLGTPHSGTMLAHLDMSPNALQMRKLSRWLTTLRAAESAQTLPHFDSVIGTHDNIVAPQNCAEYDLADNTYMSGMTHLAMANSHALIEWVIDHLMRQSQSS